MALNIYPTGTTIYDPAKCWNGYVVFQSSMMSGEKAAAVLIDMNGNIVNMWRKLDGFPNKILPGGFIMGSTGMRDPKYSYQDMLDLVVADWEGKIVWKLDKYELIKDPRRKPVWMVRQHHDYQRQGNPVGYYAPGLEPAVGNGKTLVLCHKNLKNPDISEKLLLDDTIIEVNHNGDVEWEWVCSEHFNEFGFDEAAKNAMARNPDIVRGSGAGDWMHMNSVSYLGPNRWYDAGDMRFHPDNIIWDGRQTNIIAIIDKKSGKVVWQIGPDYSATPALRKLGQIIGQHNAHMIPRGLPGAGNILVYDNGGAAGYGSPNPGSPAGIDNALRDYSRALEIDPVSLDIVWQYPPPARIPDSCGLFSFFISSAQRLPNGNTQITEGGNGRIFEVTKEGETVWEYVSPFTGMMGPPGGPGKKRLGGRVPAGPAGGPPAGSPGGPQKGGPTNANASGIYRAYRVPYEWVPQAAGPQEKAVPRIDIKKFRVPGLDMEKTYKVVELQSKHSKIKS